MLECTLESAVCRHAERTGWIARKTVYLGRRGCPDRHFYGYRQVVLVEFKQKGRRPDPLQAREHARLAAAGVPVHVVDDVQQGCDLLDRLAQTPR